MFNKGCICWWKEFQSDNISLYNVVTILHQRINCTTNIIGIFHVSFPKTTAVLSLPLLLFRTFLYFSTCSNYLFCPVYLISFILSSSICFFNFLYSFFYSFPFYPLYLYLQNLSTFLSPVSNTNTWHIPTPQTGPYNTWLLLSPRCVHNPTCLLVGEGYVQS
jgi:hypothetical protein